MMITSTMILRPAWRATNARAIASCLKRNQSAYAAAGQSVMQEPEVEARGKFLGRLQRDNSFREQTVYSLSFAGNSLESDFESDDNFPLIDDRMKRQLRNSYDALLSPSNNNAQKMSSRLSPQLSLGHLEAPCLNKSIKRKLPPLEQDNEVISAEYYSQPLPKSINDISSFKLDHDARAIVITDTKNPFRVVAVNTAWEHLCGYQREESQGRPVGPLLQGPDTDMSPVTAMLAKLLQGEQAEALLTNYTKQGRKFQNNIRLGPIFDEMGKCVNFVGVLREVNDDEGNLGNFGSDRSRMQLPFMS